MVWKGDWKGLRPEAVKKGCGSWHAYMEAVRPWLLRILEFSLVERCHGPLF